MSLSVLLVDDEPLARERLRALLDQEPDLRIAGECASGRTAVKAIQEKRPDLVFLDVQMPGLDGFGVVEQIGAGRMPAIVFVTAFDQYALKAFEVHAIDYLLKPFDRERFQATLAHARESIRLRAGGVDRAMTALLDSLAARRRYADRLLVKLSGKERLVPVDEVDWLEAAGNYVRIHAGGERLLLRETMASLEERLDPDRFARIHRSTIVNLERVKELEPWFHGDYVVRLKDGQKLTRSRSHRPRLLQKLGD
ncbi:MAG TPA: LytTR family DNA-binding domain-containing protein [Gemmatimonadales bacterium]|nr:LytTR family DNA-binding domain-containing protein [Gemmatimonadales bacterium]